MKTIVLILLCVVLKFSVCGQTYYYKQILQVTPEGQHGKGDGSGQFITFNDKGCYDSDKDGYTVNNGFLKYVQKGNGILVYYGNSYWGKAYYYFKEDRSRLNVQIEESGEVYVYTKFIALAGVETSSKIKEKVSTVSFVISTYTPPILPDITEEPTLPKRTSTKCRNCNGTGICPFCGGKGWYENIYNDHIYDCIECHGMKSCRICYGKGVFD